MTIYSGIMTFKELVEMAKGNKEFEGGDPTYTYPTVSHYIILKWKSR